jgi:hypothetical protein
VTTIGDYWPLIIYGLGIAGLAIQNQTNTRAQGKRQDEMSTEIARRQDDTNEHLRKLNDKTYNLHGQLQGVKTAVKSLPCRAATPLPEQCPEDEG